MNDAAVDRLASDIADMLIHEACAEEFAIKAGEHMRAFLAQCKKHERYFEVLFKALAPWDRKIKATIQRAWDREKHAILTNLRKLGKGYQRKGPEDMIDDILPPRSEFIRDLSAEAKKLFSAMLLERGSAYANELDVGIAFDLANPRVQDWLRKYSIEFSKNMAAADADKIKRQLMEGLEAGETIPELMSRIKDEFRTWEWNRAEVVARTESSRANNRAAQEAYEQSGVVEEKQWMTAPDCCEICNDLDGMVVGLKEDFFEADYESGEGPPRHPNCRCTVTAYFKD